jgi:hypothetical protein
MTHHSTMLRITIKSKCRRFGTGGSVSQPVNLSLRAPAQMGWRKMEHKRETWLVLSRTRGVLVVGVTSVRERERESEPVRLLVPPRDPPAGRPWTSLL